MQISAVKTSSVMSVKVRFCFDLAAWAMKFSSRAVDAVLRCLYSQPLDIVLLCQGLDRQSL